MDKLQDVLAEQQRLFMEKPMTRQEVKALITELFPAWLLAMDGTPPRVGGAALVFENGAATWGGDQPYGSAGDTEWMQVVLDTTHIRVTAGPVYWNDQILNSGYSAYYDVAYSGLSTDDERWLFVEIDMGAPSATAKFSDDANDPVDAPDTHIVRWRLSKWKKTATGIERVKTAWPGGAIHLVPASLGPPRAT